MHVCIQPKLALNLKVSCLILSSARITGPLRFYKETRGSPRYDAGSQLKAQLQRNLFHTYFSPLSFIFGKSFQSLSGYEGKHYLK